MLVKRRKISLLGMAMTSNLKAAIVARASKTVNAKKITAFKRTQMLCMLIELLSK